MSEAGVECELTTILATDIACYSHLVAAEEAGNSLIRCVSRKAFSKHDLSFLLAILPKLEDEQIRPYNKICRVVTVVAPLNRALRINPK